MNRTKIVATLGPATNSKEMLHKIMDAGVNVCRFNFSHGTHESHGETMDRIREVNKERDSHAAILLDTKGPEIRTGELEEAVFLNNGDKVTFTIDKVDYKTTGKISVNYTGFTKDVVAGDLVILDSGVILLTAIEVTDKDVICEVVSGGKVTSRRHINLRGKPVSLDSITEQDWADIKFGVEKKAVDFVALSFVRSAADIKELQDYIKSVDAHTKVVAKIENFESTENLEEIVEQTDAVMVARGDLGAEMGFEKVPALQRRIVELCQYYKKPVIVATHMLETMCDNPNPTRAEVTDISYAVLQGTDATMLSGETTTGDHPLRSVEMMAATTKETENETEFYTLNEDEICENDAEVVAKMTAAMTYETEVDTVVVVEKSSEIAKLVAHFYPRTHIHAFVEEEKDATVLALYRGVVAHTMSFSSEEKDVENAINTLLKKDSSLKGRKYVLVSGNSIEDAKIQLRTF